MGKDEDAGLDPCLSAPAFPSSACTEGCQEQGSCFALGTSPCTSTQPIQIVFKLFENSLKVSKLSVSHFQTVCHSCEGKGHEKEKKIQADEMRTCPIFIVCRLLYFLSVSSSHRATKITVNYDIIEEKTRILFDDDHISLSANKIIHSHLFLLSL